MAVRSELRTLVCSNEFSRASVAPNAREALFMLKSVALAVSCVAFAARFFFLLFTLLCFFVF